MQRSQRSLGHAGVVEVLRKVESYSRLEDAERLEQFEIMVDDVLATGVNQLVVEELAKLAAVVARFANAPRSAGEPGRCGAFGEALQVDRHVELKLPQPAAQGENFARRFVPF